MTDARTARGAILPFAVILAALLVLWYGGAVVLNGPQAASLMPSASRGNLWALARACWSMQRPELPAPHQILLALADSVFTNPLTSPRNFLYHMAVTAKEAAAGLALALVLGIGLAVGIIRWRTLDRSLMPWVIASQTVPILAIAPMVVVVLGNLGITGLFPKAAIAGYLSFFPITVGMVGGLRAADPLALDLMRTYSATDSQVFRLLRWPASLGFLFPSLKVAVALAVVGAIVAELPTGAEAGLGARLLAGSYYGQTTQMWVALMLASLLAVLGLAAVGLVERLVIALRGGRL
jgi:NitT/TauT family transport system permease protein